MGRRPTPNDGPKSAQIALVTEAFARQYFSRQDPIGSRLDFGRDATLPGVLAGCVLAGLSAKVFAHLVWGVTTTDPGTYAGVAVGLPLAAGLASLIPALRITRNFRFNRPVTFAVRNGESSVTESRP